MFNRSTLLGMLRQGQDGNQILQILDTMVSAIEDQNINECAAHYAAISTPTLQPVAF